MSRPVVIVNPRSSGVELAPAFKAKGISAIAITFKDSDRIGYGTQTRKSDFIEVIPYQEGLEEILRKYNPLAIIPGTDDAVPYAERLTAVLTPQFANDPKKATHRMHKAFMQEALKEAGVPFLKTLNSSSEEEVEAWLKENHLSEASLILKPPTSAGSDKVFQVPSKADWKKSFRRILDEPSRITGERNESVVVQEEAIGTEFAVGTVSANGKHSLTHLIKYNKSSVDGRNTVYDHVEFVPYDEELYGELFAYARDVLDSLGIRWGAAHTEVMLTAKGPRLIETGARMCGGPVVLFSRESNGSSQADRLVEMVLEGQISNRTYSFKKSVVPVFLKSPAAGKISNVEVLDEATTLPTLFGNFAWIKNGDQVPKTVDYLTSIGIITLAGDRESIFRDYERIREMESKLVVS